MGIGLHLKGRLVIILLGYILMARVRSLIRCPVCGLRAHVKRILGSQIGKYPVEIWECRVVKGLGRGKGFVNEYKKRNLTSEEYRNLVLSLYKIVKSVLDYLESLCLQEGLQWEVNEIRRTASKFNVSLRCALIPRRVRSSFVPKVGVQMGGLKTFKER